MRWKWYALVGITTFAFYLWICRPLIASYFPTTDDIAIDAASTQIGGQIHPSVWFTQGFEDYFRPYAEWGSRPSNFFRPLFNALFWSYYQIFGTHWAYQLVFGYLVHALAVSLSAYLAIAVFGLTRPVASLSTLIAALNPACWSLYPDTFAIPPVAQFPAYQTEIICGALMLAAFLAFIRCRFVLFAIATTLALFLKETALTIPIAALAMTGVWITPERGRSVRNFLWLAMPLALWFIIRLKVFEYGFSSFVMMSGKPLSWLTQPIRNTLIWPTGLYISALGQTAAALRMHEWNIVSAQAFELGANTAWWAAIALAVVQTLRQYGRGWFVTAPAPWVAGLVFAGSNLALLVALQETHLRYGYLWFALGPAAVFGVLSRRRAGMALSAALALALAVPQLWSIRSALSDDSVRNYSLVKRAARQLTSLLASLPSGVSTVYLIDDMAVHVVAPKYMAKFSGYQGRLQLVNSIRPVPHCSPVAQTAPRYRLTSQGDMTVLEYSVPTCFEPYFGLPPLALIAPDNSVQRGPWMTYQFPELSVADRSATAQYGVGRTWRVSSHDPICMVMGACVWIGLDEHSGQYYQLDDATRVD
jgi:hypothetical protein